MEIDRLTGHTHAYKYMNANSAKTEQTTHFKIFTCAFIHIHFNRQQQNQQAQHLCVNRTCTRTLNKIHAICSEIFPIGMTKQRNIVVNFTVAGFCLLFSLDLLFKLCTLTLYLFDSHTVGSSLLKSITNFHRFFLP